MSSLRDRLARANPDPSENGGASGSNGNDAAAAVTAHLAAATSHAAPTHAANGHGSTEPVSTDEHVPGKRAAAAAAQQAANTAADDSVGRRKALAATQAQSRIEDLKATVHAE